jgi:hypothetical protein
MRKKDTKNSLESMVSNAPPEPAPYVAKPKRDKTEGRFYPMTFRIPRPTADLLSEIAFVRKTSLQAIVAEAVDLWLRKEQQGTFLPKGWQDEKREA